MYTAASHMHQAYAMISMYLLCLLDLKMRWMLNLDEPTKKMEIRLHCETNHPMVFGWPKSLWWQSQRLIFWIVELVSIAFYFLLPPYWISSSTIYRHLVFLPTKHIQGIRVPWRCNSNHSILEIRREMFWGSTMGHWSQKSESSRSFSMFRSTKMNKCWGDLLGHNKCWGDLLGYN